jgi:hypothetical protein
LSQIPNYLTLNEIAIRHILPSGWFDCPTQLVPFKVGEATTADDGLMGLYSPLIDYPLATKLPPTASEATCPKGYPGCGACGSFPDGPPAVQPACQVLSTNSTTITSVTTQCSNIIGFTGCNQFVVQSNPPIAIAGSGFGSLPLGIPYNGNSNFLEITDTTQTPNWSAGYTGNTCTVSIGEWSDGLISLIANVNQNGACPMAAGDQLTITVWNPQTLSSFAFPVTVVAQTGGVRKPK